MKAICSLILQFFLACSIFKLLHCNQNAKKGYLMKYFCYTQPKSQGRG